MSEIIEKLGGNTGVTQSVGAGLTGEIGNSATVGGNGGSGISNNAGGALLPTQSRQFIDYIFDQMVLAKDGRRVVMQANTMELDKIQVGNRVVRKANQGLLTGVTATGGANSVTYPGVDNTGGGGGGQGLTPSSGNGGKGIVIIRYSGSQDAFGGTVTSSGGYTIHTFTGDGTFTSYSIN